MVFGWIGLGFVHTTVMKSSSEVEPMLSGSPMPKSFSDLYLSGKWKKIVLSATKVASSHTSSANTTVEKKFINSAVPTEITE